MARAISPMPTDEDDIYSTSYLLDEDAQPPHKKTRFAPISINDLNGDHESSSDDEVSQYMKNRQSSRVSL